MDDGSEKPIAFASRTLAPAERNYAQIEKEGLSCVFGVTRFHSFLYGRRFTLVTDHKPLLGLINEDRPIPAQASARIQRWALTLASYDYTLRFKRTSDHANADALSRLPLPSSPSSIPIPAETVLLMETLDASPITAADLRTWTRRDPTLSRVFRYVECGWHDDHDCDDDMKPYRQRRTELSIQDDCLLWGNRLIIPQQGRQRVLSALHDGHPGIARMKSFARAIAWWPKMDSDIERVSKACTSCKENQAMPPKEPLHPWSWPSRPWSRLHIDHAGPFMGKLFLIVVDAYSKWMEVVPVASTNTATTVDKLRAIFATHGLPDKIVSDNGTAFTSEAFQEFVRKNGISHTTSAPYHPASNGLAERAVRTFKEAMRCMEGGSVETRIARFLLKYRTTPHSTTGVAPSQLLMGRRLTTVLDRMRPDVASRVHGRQVQQKANHDKGTKERAFVIGQNVFAKNFTSAMPKWLKGKVIRSRGPGVYDIELDDERVIRRHADHIQEGTVPRCDVTHANSRAGGNRDVGDTPFTYTTPPLPPTTPPLPPLVFAPEVIDTPVDEVEGRAPRKTYPPRDRKPPNRYGVPLYY